MKKVILNNGFMTFRKAGEATEMYSMDEIKNYPNISQEEIDACKEVYEVQKRSIAGFVKSYIHTDEDPVFVQVYKVEVATYVSEEGDE